MTKRKRKSQRTLMSFKLPADVRRWLETIKDRDGVPFTTQLEKAMQMYAASKGVHS